MTRLRQEAAPGQAESKPRCELTAAQMAYGLLWREMRVSDRPFVSGARTVLLASLTTAEQRGAIEWVQGRYPIAENEIVSEASCRRSSEGSSREGTALPGKPAASSGRASR